jgi:group I intron endonuclease
MSSTGKIYCAHCIPTGKKYIGQTIRNNLNLRVAEHFTNANKRNKKGKFQKALNKYGNHNFIWGIIEEYDILLLNQKEVYWIAEYKTVENGYNLSPGGGQPPEYFCKEYLIETPDGERKNIKNLSQYCRDNCLNVGHLHETLYGGRVQHKGYRLIPRTDNEIKKYQMRRKNVCENKKKGLIKEQNGMFGKKHKNITKEKMLERKREIFAKTYHLISPKGEEVILKTTLREFCRKYGLERKSLTNVIKGKAKHHKGWTVPQPSKND